MRPGGRLAMELTGAVVATGGAEAIPIPRDPAIQRPPQQHASGEVRQRSRQPEPRKAAGQMPNGLGSPMAAAALVDDQHLFHEPVAAEVRPAAVHLGIVQREVRQAVPPIELR